MVVEVLILISPVKSEDNRLPESDGNAESSDGYIMPVGMFVLIFSMEYFYWSVIKLLTNAEWCFPSYKSQHL